MLALLLAASTASCVASEDVVLDDEIEAAESDVDSTSDTADDEASDEDVAEDTVATAETEETDEAESALSSPRAETVRLVPAQGHTGTQRVNFAIPLAPGELFEESMVRVMHEGRDLPLARRGLARHADGSLRSVQIQVDVAVAGETELRVIVGERSKAGALSMVPVQQTLVNADGTLGPRVYALLSPQRLAKSGVMGTIAPESETAGSPYDGWAKVCDYNKHDVDAFLPKKGDPAVWLYDRGTTFYRGYARRGDVETLRTAYAETALYRAGISGSGKNLEIGIPKKANDPKYHYSQNLAIHYLLTGDDRFREAAESVADRMASIWKPRYKGKDTGLWTERHAGFYLLDMTYAMMVSDDQSAHFQELADNAVDAYLDVQATYPQGYGDSNARCFAHHAGAHGEGYGYFGCSPWMSAILADGLDLYASERGGQRENQVHASIVKLGRAIAREGMDSSGKPYYFMGEGGTGRGEEDPDNEHWGEAAYVMAMAYHYSHDASLANAVGGLVAKLKQNGRAPHMRSFNWQCRSAVATPAYMR
ncbi:hypothetical protein [Polyangium jinanense]|uniref:Uncharacterized protein n=1 Tax=Polyangium jinanense TaxID=2829994 RepID=A0A9X3X4D4_9BACT|nr:hypothetical protein [Polyangium jinanense]MDC3961326.1 hypothetical protein [Polyangium jinanense]MDC3984042.1 hypothetical protein [Polyangium jinanense]